MWFNATATPTHLPLAQVRPVGDVWGELRRLVRRVVIDASSVGGEADREADHHSAKRGYPWRAHGCGGCVMGASRSMGVDRAMSYKSPPPPSASSFVFASR